MRPTARERADFDRDGAVLVKGVVPVEWLGALGDAIERDIAEPGPYFTGYRPEVGRFHGNQRVWEKDEGFRAFCCEGPLREPAARFLGAERLNLFYDQLFVKEPGTAAADALAQRPALLARARLAGDVLLAAARPGHARERRARLRRRLAPLGALVPA